MQSEFPAWNVFSRQCYTDAWQHKASYWYDQSVCYSKRDSGLPRSWYWHIDTVITTTTLSSTRFTIKGIEDGDCFQASPHQWSLNHVPSFLPPAPNVICNYILQTILLWSSCNSKLVHLIGDNHFICEVSVKQIRLGSMFN